VARHIFKLARCGHTQSIITSIMKKNYKHFTSVNLTYTSNSLTLYSLTLVLSIRILLTTTTTSVDCPRHIAFKLTWTWFVFNLDQLELTRVDIQLMKVLSFFCPCISLTLYWSGSWGSWEGWPWFARCERVDLLLTKYACDWLIGWIKRQFFFNVVYLR
jgi:hypothetical protein